MMRSSGCTFRVPSLSKISARKFVRWSNQKDAGKIGFGFPLGAERMAGLGAVVIGLGLTSLFWFGSSKSEAKTRPSRSFYTFACDLLKPNEVSKAAPEEAKPVVAFFVNSFAANDPLEDTYDHLIQPRGSLFGVFDGHSGTAASYWCKNHFLGVLNSELRTSRPNSDKDIERTLKSAFIKADNLFLEDCLQRGLPGIIEGTAGACTIVTYVTPSKVYVANAGDCRTVLGRIGDDGTWQAVAMSRDQTADDPIEELRLRSEHPNEPDVVKKGRVKGYLQPARGIGDGIYKRKIFNDTLNKRKQLWEPPYTTAEPEVKIETLTSKDKFVVMATDGLWDFYSSQEVVQLVGHYLDDQKANPSTQLIADVLAAALSSRRRDANPETLQALVSLPATSRRKIYDDTTVVIIKLQN